MPNSEEIAALTASTTQLTEEVVGQKDSLDAQVVIATTKAENTAADAVSTAADANSANQAKVAAETAENNAVAVVTGGTATLEPEAGKIPLADAEGKIAVGWLPLDYSKSVSWNSTTDTYNDSDAGVTAIHKGMKRCLLLANGTVNYYLDKDDSAYKEDGTASVLDGSDGNVMVEIPKFYFKESKVNVTTTWEMSGIKRGGYELHPAFFKDGAVVDFRYMGAYDACFYSDSSSTYLSGLTLDDADYLIDYGTDKLSSVMDVYPICGVTRANARTLAVNNGTGWRQQDFWLTSAVQLLFLIEYGTFASQAELGSGNTNGSYVGSSSVQADSPHSIAGASNSWGNKSTDGTQPSAGAKPGTAYMSYRGIENFLGNCWDWVDGFNIISNQGYVGNDSQYFIDDTASNLADIGMLSANNGWAKDFSLFNGSFVPTEVGGSSSTFMNDYYYQDSGNRVANIGGDADYGAIAGAFCWSLTYSSGYRHRNIAARVSF